MDKYLSFFNNLSIKNNISRSYLCPLQAFPTNIPLFIGIRSVFTGIIRNFVRKWGLRPVRQHENNN